MANFYEIDETVDELVPVYGTAGQTVQARAPKTGATVILKNAGTSTARTAYDAPSGSVLSSLATVNGRIQGPAGQHVFVSGETPVDIVVNQGQPNEFTLRWSPPQLGGAGPTGPQGPSGSPWVTTADYPLIVPETDDTARFARAAAALHPTRGGTLYSPGILTISSWPSFEGTTSVTLKGQGGRSAGAAPSSQIVYTGTAVVNVRSTYGFRVEDVAVQYTNGSLAGKLFDGSYGASSRPTAFMSFERCTITGTLSTATGCTALISLANAHDVSITDCLFNFAACAIRGKDVGGVSEDFSNAVRIVGCEFGNLTGAAIQSAGQGWTIIGTGEPTSAGGAGLYAQTVGKANGVSFSNFWLGDSGASGTWISYAGSGLTVTGNYISGGVTGVALTSSTFGVTITGNHFEGFGSSPLTTGVDVATGCQNVIVLGNYFKTSGATIVTNPITLVDDPPGSIFQHVSNENTTPLTLFSGKIVTHDWIQGQAITAPGAPAASNGRMYFELSGGRVRLMVKFPTGAAQQVAIEP